MTIPVPSSASIDTTGLLLTIVWPLNVGNVAAGAQQKVVAAGRLFTTTFTYSSGTGTTTTVFTLAAKVYQSETVTVNIPAGLVADALVGTDQNAAATAFAVTNGSTQTVAAACDGIARGMFVNRCMLLRDTESQSNTTGAISDSWAVAAYPLCCSVQGLSSRETFQGMRDQPGWTFTGYFPVSSGVRNTDRVAYVTGYGVSGLANKILEVDGPAIDHAGRGAYLAVPLVEVPGNGG